MKYPCSKSIILGSLFLVFLFFIVYSLIQTYPLFQAYPVEGMTPAKDAKHKPKPKTSVSSSDISTKKLNIPTNSPSPKSKDPKK